MTDLIDMTREESQKWEEYKREQLPKSLEKVTKLDLDELIQEMDEIHADSLINEIHRNDAIGIGMTLLSFANKYYGDWMDNDELDDWLDKERGCD